MNYSPTPAQHAIKQSAIAGTVTAIATIAAGTYQYVLGHGLNLPALLGFLAPFVTAQAVTLWHTLTISPQFKVAAGDTATNLPEEIKALPSAIGGLHQKIDQLLAHLLRQPAPLQASVPSVFSTAPTPAPVQPAPVQPARQFQPQPVSQPSAVIPAVPVLPQSGQA